jgi:hypothetical protein
MLNWKIDLPFTWMIVFLINAKSSRILVLMDYGDIDFKNGRSKYHGSNDVTPKKVGCISNYASWWNSSQELF